VKSDPAALGGLAPGGATSGVILFDRADCALVGEALPGCTRHSAPICLEALQSAPPSVERSSVIARKSSRLTPEGERNCAIQPSPIAVDRSPSKVRCRRSDRLGLSGRCSITIASTHSYASPCPIRLWQVRH